MSSPWPRPTRAAAMLAMCRKPSSSGRIDAAGRTGGADAACRCAGPGGTGCRRPADRRPPSIRRPVMRQDRRLRNRCRSGPRRQPRNILSLGGAVRPTRPRGPSARAGTCAGTCRRRSWRVAGHARRPAGPGEPARRTGPPGRRTTGCPARLRAPDARSASRPIGPTLAALHARLTAMRARLADAAAGADVS